MLDAIATYLSRFPAIKRAAKFAFQSVNYGLHFHLRKLNCRFPVSRVSDNEGGFFGYYDKSPESADGRYILYHGLSKGYEQEGVSICLKDTVDNTCKIISRSRAYNLQAGARLHWISADRFIFNNYNTDTDSYNAVIYDCNSDRQYQIPAAVYDTNSENYLAVDYKNLAACNSEYGYFAHKPATDVPVPVILSGNFSSNELTTLVQADTVKVLLPDAFEGTHGLHFNHAMYNLSGSAFVFIVRWTGINGRTDALLHHDLKNGVTRVINTEMTSHYCWIDDTHIFGYLSHNSKRGYYSVSTSDLIFTEFKNDALKGDGHPTFKNGIFLTDTYPDSARMQHLMIMHNGRVSQVGEFFAPLKFNEAGRCDLHPRFNTAGNRIYIDSRHEGPRHLYSINFKQP